MIYHFQMQEQPKWLEIAFPHIFRIPYSGIRLGKYIYVEGEQ